MLDALNIVRGAVSTKDLLPVLTHFHLYDGRIQGADGRIAIDAACEQLTDVNATVPAIPFLRAIEACNGEPDSIEMTDSKVVIRKKKFRARLSALDNSEYPRAEIEKGTTIKLTDTFLPALKRLHPVIGTDASRLWAMGVLFKGGACYATNNVVIFQCGAPITGSEFILPVFAIDELLRIGEPPLKMSLVKNAVVFHFKTWWLKSQLITQPWPEVDKFFIGFKKKLPAIPTQLLPALKTLSGFEAQSVRINKDGTVVSDDGKHEVSIDVESKLHDSIFNTEHLMTALTAATQWDVAQYPGKVPFIGTDTLRGFIVGIKP